MIQTKKVTPMTSLPSTYLTRKKRHQKHRLKLRKSSKQLLRQQFLQPQQSLEMIRVSKRRLRWHKSKCLEAERLWI